MSFQGIREGVSARGVIRAENIPIGAEEIYKTPSFIIYIDRTTGELILYVKEYGANFLAIPKDVLEKIINSF